MGKLKTHFLKFGFNEAESNKIVGYFKKQQLNKGDYFVNEGQMSLQMGFIESGQFRYYSIAEKGEERTTYISLENSFVASLLTYLTEIPAKENIVALTNATIWVIEKKDVEYLQKQLSAFKDFYIKLIEYHICCIDKSRLDLITLSAEQRYEKFIKEDANQLDKVPLQYIASILGITPRHLSRLRKKNN